MKTLKRNVGNVILGQVNKKSYFQFRRSNNDLL